jgi:predicted Zn-dependent peptidase
VSNGLTLLIDPVPHVRSASFAISVQAGCAYEPADRSGLASLTLDLMTRGAGSRDNRALNQALDSLGVDRSESNGVMTLGLSARMLARNLHQVLTIYADIVRRPLLPENELEPVRQLARQEIASLADDPQSRVMIELRRNYLPEPLGRNPDGTEAGIEATTIDDVRRHWERFIRPNQTIISIAGNVDVPAVRAWVEDLFGDWKATDVPELAIQDTPPKSQHIQEVIEQTQIAWAYPSVPMTHPDYYAAKGAVGILSSGMSSRLFTNVREAHGLCYAITASLTLTRGRGDVIGYTAGEPHNAQELLDRTLHEFRRLGDGIEEEELARVKARLKAGAVMSLESTAARASANLHDWYFLGRVRSLTEVQQAIDGLTSSAIIDHLRRFPPRNFTIVTLGPEPLKWDPS